MRQDRAHEWGSWSKPSSDIAQPRNREARERHSEHATGQRRFEMGGQYDNAGLRRARRVAGRYISLRRANAQLADWIAASERRLSTIYITHGHPDHFFGLKLLRDRFPEARALATPQVVDAMQAALRPESVVPVDQGEAVRGLPRSIIERTRFWVTVSGE